MTNIMIEVQRTNVTVAEFLNYVAKKCAEKGVERGFSRDEFEKPYNEYRQSYHVTDGKKYCSFKAKREVTKLRRKHASYVTSEGFKRYYYTDELEEYTETEIHSYEQIWEAEEEPCQSEIINQFPYDYQIFVRNWNGTCYNETCEFTFDDDKRGYGYYYRCEKNEV
ncbi:MAG: hypothetical protein LBT22_08465 [Peptococcaceae bacterium]|jgi:hypothetical protein|nr:hypothetical protein [Peptococcaceae bacterium]